MKDLQGQFLSRLQAERQNVILITINGFQARGQIAGHDQYTILIDVDGQQQLVYKSAVSTIKEA